MKELVMRLRKEATEQRKWAATFAPDLPWCVEDVGVWELDEVKHAATAVFHAANKALDLEQAAEALERQQRALAQAGVTDLARYEQDSGLEVPKP
jgi:hypothetical protein